MSEAWLSSLQRFNLECENIKTQHAKHNWMAIAFFPDIFFNNAIVDIFATLSLGTILTVMVIFWV